MKRNSDFNTREEALSNLWEKREEFEKGDKLLEFERLEKEIKERPVLNLAVATELDFGEITEKAREIVGQDIFVDFRIDPSLVGGVVIIWKGQVIDYSVRKVMQEKRDEFKKIFLQWK